MFAHIEADVGECLDAAERERDVVQLEDDLANGGANSAHKCTIVLAGANSFARDGNSADGPNEFGPTTSRYLIGAPSRCAQPTRAGLLLRQCAGRRPPCRCAHPRT